MFLCYVLNNDFVFLFVFMLIIDQCYIAFHDEEWGVLIRMRPITHRLSISTRDVRPRRSEETNEELWPKECWYLKGKF